MTFCLFVTLHFVMRFNNVFKFVAISCKLIEALSRYYVVIVGDTEVIKEFNH